MQPTAATPEEPQRTEHCPKHGRFSAKRVVYEWPRRSEHWRGCPKCNEERIRENEERENQQRLAAIVEAAGIPKRFKNATLDNFQVENDEQRINLDLARTYVAEFADNLKAGRCLIFCGGVGTGKTHLACGIVQALALAGRSVQYMTVQDLIRKVRNTWRKDSWCNETEVMGSVGDRALLVLDEIGVQFGTEAEKMQLFDVINTRYNANRPTVVISNLGLDGLKTYLGDRAMDRLRENGGRVLVFTGKSWRGRPGE